MKRLLFILMLGAGLTACTGNDGSTPGQKLDTLLKKADTLAEKIDTTAGKVWDSTKSKVRRLDDKIGDALRKDTTEK